MNSASDLYRPLGARQALLHHRTRPEIAGNGSEWALNRQCGKAESVDVVPQACILVTHPCGKAGQFCRSGLAFESLQGESSRTGCQGNSLCQQPFRQDLL